MRYIRLDPKHGSHSHSSLGDEGTVIGPDDWNIFDYRVRMDKDPTNGHYFFAGELEPAVPPAEDTWAAIQVRKWTKPEHTVLGKTKEKA